MNVIHKDILTITKGIIAHQCNCKGVMGSGLALQVRNKYPFVYMQYRETYLAGALTLGTTQFIQVSQDLYVANLLAQEGYGRDKQYTDTKALTQCLKDLHQRSIEWKLDVYIPYGIGCGLGGGKWNVVSELIEVHCPNAIVCKL